MTCSVYRFYDGQGRLLYVGVTGRGLTRAREHSRSKEWWELVKSSTVEHLATTGEALERERELIRSLRPIYNVQHNGAGPAAALTRPQRREVIVDEVGSGIYAGAHDVKARRRIWYALDRADRRTAPCVGCMARPGERGPMCGPCLRDERGSRDR
ncbi:MAG: hypothetical protein WD670_04515 [Actinomycetota bacterium]